jgi:hypothetical protein
MSTGAIVAIVVVGLLLTGMVALRVAVAKQRRAVDSVRARLAASSTVTQRAEAVQIETLFHMRGSVGRASRSATCARAADGLYCLSDDGRWGGRIPFAPGPLQPGDVALAAAPCLVKDGTVVGALPGWMTPLLASLPPEALVLQLAGADIVWIVGLPEAEAWYGALTLALQQGAAAAPSAPAATT